MRKSLIAIAAIAALGGAAPAAADATFQRALAQPVAFAGHGNVHALRIDNFVANETLQLRLLLGLGQRFDGRRVEAVEVRLGRHQPELRLTLLGDGHRYDAGRAGRGDRVVLRPRQGGVLGRDIDRLMLRFEGGGYVQSIRVVLAGPPVLRGWPRQDDRGWERRDDRRDDTYRDDRRRGRDGRDRDDRGRQGRENGNRG